MEDTHVWVMDADGKNRRELTGAIDNRQGERGLVERRRSVLFTVQERRRSASVPTRRSQVARPVAVVSDRGSVGFLVGARRADCIRVHDARGIWRSCI